MINGGDCVPEAALFHLEEAIRIFDSCSVPPDITAHADLAKARLEEWLAGTSMAEMPARPLDFGISDSIAEH